MENKNKEKEIKYLKKIKASFARRGINFRLAYLENVNRDIIHRFFREGTEWNREYFERISVIDFGCGRRNEIENFKVYCAKLGLDKKYNKLPDWFLEGIKLETVMTASEDLVFGVSAVYGKNTICREAFEKSYDLTCFEEMAGFGNRENYLLKKTFHPGEAEKMVIDSMYCCYEEMEENITENEKAKEWTKEVSKLAGEFYDIALEIHLASIEQQHN